MPEITALKSSAISYKSTLPITEPIALPTLSADGCERVIVEDRIHLLYWAVTPVLNGGPPIMERQIVSRVSIPLDVWQDILDSVRSGKSLLVNVGLMS